MQESIKASSAWFLACSLHAGGMADMVINRILASPDFQSQLHLLYLMNDIFFVGCARCLRPTVPAARMPVPRHRPLCVASSQRRHQ